MAFLSSEARFGPFLDTVKHKADPGPLTYTPPEHFQAFPAPYVTSKHGSFGPHHDPRFDPRAISAGVAAVAAVDPSVPPNLKDQAPSPWQYSPSVDGQFPRAFTADDIQRVRNKVALAQPVVRQKQRHASPLKGKTTKSGEGEVSLAKLRLALGPGSYEVDRDVNQEKISTHFSFSREKRRGIMDHVLIRGENGYSPGLVNSETAAGFSVRSNRGTTDNSSNSVCSSPGLGHYHSETATAGGLGTRAMSEAPFKSKHASGFVLRVRSESEFQRQRQDVEKFSKELAKSYKQLDASMQKLDRRVSSPSIRAASFQRFDKEPQMVESYRRGPGSYDHNITLHFHPKTGSSGSDQYQNRGAHLVSKPRSNFGCVQHRDLVRFMVAAGHISTDHRLTTHVDATRSGSTTPDNLLPAKHRLKIPLDKPEKPETADLSREEMWRVLKNGPSMMRTPVSGTRSDSRHAERHRAGSPVAKASTQLDEMTQPPENLPES